MAGSQAAARQLYHVTQQSNCICMLTQSYHGVSKRYERPDPLIR